MLSRLFSVVAVLIAVACLCAATTFFPNGFDWNRDFISTLLRGPAGLSRWLADVGVIFFCVGLALVFNRLARAPEFAKQSKVIQIAGIGSMVYSAITITPLHDLMVTVSLIFFLTAATPLIWALRANRETVLVVAGCICLAVMLASATIYYTSQFVVVLPWAQRISFSLIAVWLLSLDWIFPRVRISPEVEVLTSNPNIDN